MRGNPWQCDFNLKSQISMPGTQAARALRGSTCPVPTASTLTARCRLLNEHPVGFSEAEVNFVFHPKGPRDDHTALKPSGRDLPHHVEYLRGLGHGMGHGSCPLSPPRSGMGMELSDKRGGDRAATVPTGGRSNGVPVTLGSAVVLQGRLQGMAGLTVAPPPAPALNCHKYAWLRRV